MSVKCDHCGAPYKSNMSPYSKFVTCANCGCVIRVNANTESHTVRKIVYEEEKTLPQKTFDILKFERFLIRKGVKTFDATSGILRVGSLEVLIKPDGLVEGSKHLKSRVERWIEEFMANN